MRKLLLTVLISCLAFLATACNEKNQSDYTLTGQGKNWSVECDVKNGSKNLKLTYTGNEKVPDDVYYEFLVNGDAKSKGNFTLNDQNQSPPSISAANNLDPNDSYMIKIKWKDHKETLILNQK